MILVASALAEAKVLVLNNHNHVLLADDIMPESVNSTIEQLTKLVEYRGNNDYPIYLVIKSDGGLVDEGDKLAQYLSEQKKIDTISIIAISAAAFIVEDNKGVRYVTKDSKMMFHQIVMQVCGTVVSEDAEIVLNDVKVMIEQRERYAAVISGRLGISALEYMSKIPSTEQLWFEGQDLLGRDGMRPADEMVTLKCESENYRTLKDCNF